MSKASDTPFSRVEVITSVERRRRWSVAEKVRLVEEAMQPGMSVSYVARRAGFLPPSSLPGSAACSKAVMPLWKLTKMWWLPPGFANWRSASAISSGCSGRKTMENEILKEAIEVARPKKHTLPLVSWNDPEDGSR